MRSTNTYEFILIGLRIRYLQSLETDNPVEAIKETIEKFHESLDHVGFEVSLIAFQLFLDNCWNEIEAIKKEDKIDGVLAEKIMDEMMTVESTVFAEACTKKVYTIPQRRYNGKYLSETHEKLLKAGIYDHLSDITKFDFDSACRCILYGESTASAFHILRTTEGVLKQYYFHYKKTGRLKKPMWGPMSVELRAKKTNKPDPTILNSLDVVRISYRNPTQHPDAIYDIESAQDLFGVCIDLINKMIAAII